MALFFRQVFPMSAQHVLQLLPWIHAFGVKRFRLPELGGEFVAGDKVFRLLHHHAHLLEVVGGEAVGATADAVGAIDV